MEVLIMNSDETNIKEAKKERKRQVYRKNSEAYWKRQVESRGLTRIAIWVDKDKKEMISKIVKLVNSLSDDRISNIYNNIRNTRN